MRKTSKDKTSGRPKSLTNKDKEKIVRLAKFGFTDDQISEVFGITKQTLNNYKKYDPVFFDSLKASKLLADVDVIDSLYKRALGMKVKEEKAMSVSDGHMGAHIEKVEVWKELPPDPTSMIFWLKNRQPDKFREKVEHFSEQEISVTVTKHKDD